MTMIDVDTSPLQAAREWRGTSLVAAARACGLQVAQAEALEDGDTAAFSSIDEMIAAAVLYGASLGIGRDEAMALLDRTVSGTPVQVQLPSTPGAFSRAVRERSARMEAMHVASTPAAVRVDGNGSAVAAPAPSRVGADRAAELRGPTPEQATAAAAEISIDTSSFSPDHGWDRPAGGELASWVADGVADVEAGAASKSSVGVSVDGGVPARIGGLTFRALERVIGSERADSAAENVERGLVRTGDLVRTGRERLRRSEHATLIVAMTAGALLVALLVAVASSIGGDDERRVAPRPAAAAETTAKPAAVDAAPVKAAPKPAPVLPPMRLMVNVFNAGSQSGAAKKLAATLEARGYKLGKVENTKTEYASSLIIHPKNRQREADALSRATGITTMDIAPGSTTAMTVIIV